MSEDFLKQHLKGLSVGNVRVPKRSTQIRTTSKNLFLNMEQVKFLMQLLQIRNRFSEMLVVIEQCTKSTFQGNLTELF